MRRVINWVLLVLALAALAAGVLAREGLLHAPAPPLAFGVAAAALVALLAICSLPLKVRRPVVFLVTLLGLGALIADAKVELALNLTIHLAHGEITKKLLRGGKHVHSEKPLATTRADGQACAGRAGDHNPRPLRLRQAA